MKKFFFIFSLLLLSGSGFSFVSNYGNDLSQSPCGMYAAEASAAESEYYGYELNSWEEFDAYMWYYDFCVGNSGTVMLQPVFL